MKNVGHLFVYRSERAVAEGERRLGAAARQRHRLGRVRRRRAAPARSEPVARVRQGRARARERPHRQPAPAGRTALAEVFRRNGGRIERARAVGFELDGNAAHRHPHRGRHACRRRGCGRRRRLVKAARGRARRRDPARDRARLSPDDPRSRGRRRASRWPTPTASSSRPRWRLGLRVAGTVELAGLKAPPNWERARMLLKHVHRHVPGAQGELSGRAPLDVDGAPAEHAGLAPRDRPLAPHARRRLRLRARPCRHGGGADDRQVGGGAGVGRADERRTSRRSARRGSAEDFQPDAFPSLRAQATKQSRCRSAMLDCFTFGSQ